MDSLIRKGQQGQAREILLALNLKKTPRALQTEIADIARRVNTPKVIIRLLKPVVHQEIPQQKPSKKEQALYATALSRLGVFEEAQKILKKLDSTSNPEVLLFLGQHFMLQWDNLSALPKLKKYISRKDISSYSRLVGKVNLMACLVGEMRWAESQKAGEEIWLEIKSLPSDSEERENFNLLYANSLGLSAHSLFLQGKFEKARDQIIEAQQILVGTKSRYELLIKKWVAILDFFRDPKDPENLTRFLTMLSEAVKARDWETVRDFEFYQALALRDDELFLKLYQGTPYPSFRKRIKKIYKPLFKIPKMLDWNIYGVRRSSANVKVFDLSKGCEIGGSSQLTTYPMLFKLLQFLTKDIYRPVALGSLFSALYPGEYYDPNSSPNRTLLVVKRLRQWLTKNQIPLEIEVYDEWFKLVAKSDYIIRVSFQNLSVTKNDSLLESLEHQFLTQSFTKEQIAENLGLPESTVKRFLTWALKKNKLRRLKSGKTS